jgi:hypothetical protein
MAAKKALNKKRLLKVVFVFVVSEVLHVFSSGEKTFHVPSGWKRVVKKRSFSDR